MNTKLHAICDNKSRPLNLFVSAGQVSDDIGARAIVSSLPKVDWLFGVCGYDADWFKDALKGKGIRAHPGTVAAQEGRVIRQAALQTTQPHRDHVRQAQGLATRRNTL
nr:hypothetical protein [Pacificoceanicola onchidii]